MTFVTHLAQQLADMHSLAFVGFVETGSLVVTVVAVAAVLILGALWVITTALAHTFNGIPVVGPPIGRAFTAAAHAMRSATLATWHGSLWALDRLIRAAAAAFRNMNEAIQRGTNAVASAVIHQAYVLTPRAISVAKAYAAAKSAMVSRTAGNAVQSLRRQVDYYHAQDRAYARQQANAAEQRAAKAAGVTVTQLRQSMAASASNLSRQVQAARQFTVTQAGQEAAARQAGDAQAVTQATQQAAARADMQAQAAWAPAWAGIATGVAGAIRVAGSDFPAITRQLQAIPTEPPATYAQAQSAASSAIPPLMKALEDCVLPNCRDLSPVRKLTSQLTDAIFAALLLAWIVQMITDPVTWAHENYDAFGPLIDGAMVVVNELKAA